MPTVSDFIHSSFRLIGAIAAGETLETNELNDAFVSLNQLLFSWNTEGVSVMGRQRLFIALVAGQNLYPLSTWPIRIEAASASVNGIDCPLELVDATGWEAITEKGDLAILARKLYCDYYWPTPNLYIWPTPRGIGQLELLIFQLFTAFPALSAQISLPPGYEQALRYNFAVALLPEYPRSQADPSLAPQAQAYKASLVQLNASNLVHTAQPALATLAAQGTS